MKNGMTQAERADKAYTRMMFWTYVEGFFLVASLLSVFLFTMFHVLR